MAYKARIRSYIQDAFQDKEGCDILNKEAASLNRAIAEGVLSVNNTDKITKNANKKSAEASLWMAKKYWDVRTFGAVMSTGLNAGQIRGAVQIEMSLSVDPIQPADITITRRSYADGEFDTLDKYDEADAKRDEDKKRTMGICFFP